MSAMKISNNCPFLYSCFNYPIPTLEYVRSYVKAQLLRAFAKTNSRAIDAKKASHIRALHSGLGPLVPWGGVWD